MALRVGFAYGHARADSGGGDSDGDEVTDIVLDGVDFDVEPRAMVALVGPTGVGKSTVAKLLSHLDGLNEGPVNVAGYGVREATVASLLKNIGDVGQDTFLFDGSVAENIRNGHPRTDESSNPRHTRNW